MSAARSQYGGMTKITLSNEPIQDVVNISILHARGFGGALLNSNECRMLGEALIGVASARRDTYEPFRQRVLLAVMSSIAWGEHLTTGEEYDFHVVPDKENDMHHVTMFCGERRSVVSSYQMLEDAMQLHTYLLALKIGKS